MEMFLNVRAAVAAVIGEVDENRHSDPTLLARLHWAGGGVPASPLGPPLIRGAHHVPKIDILAAPPAAAVKAEEAEQVVDQAVPLVDRAGTQAKDEEADVHEAVRKVQKPEPETKDDSDDAIQEPKPWRRLRCRKASAGSAPPPEPVGAPRSIPHPGPLEGPRSFDQVVADYKPKQKKKKGKKESEEHRLASLRRMMSSKSPNRTFRSQESVPKSPTLKLSHPRPPSKQRRPGT